METLLKSSKKLYQNYQNKVIDLLLFGSFAKNKTGPRDIDIAVILKNTKESEFLSLNEELAKFFDKKVHLNLVLIDTMLSNQLFKTLMTEGVSLLDNKPLSQKLGYESGAIFSLNLTGLEKSKKVLFSYALHGKKNQDGILKKVSGKEIGRAVLLIPVNFAEEFRQFLEEWNVDFYMIKILKS